MSFNLKKYGIDVVELYRNASVPALYELALTKEKGTTISDAGALCVYSGEKTGRNPKDKRIVRNPASEYNIDWGDINIALDKHVFHINRERAIDYLNTRSRIYVVDAFARTKAKLVELFQNNFKQFEAEVNTEISAAGPE